MHHAPLATLIGYWISAFLTIAVLTFLYKDNPFYKLAEHLFVGVAAGYGVCQEYFSTLVPNLIHPLAHPGELGAWWIIYVAGALLCIMMFAKFSRNMGWMARWPLAFVVGTFAGLSMIQYAQGDLVAQVEANMLPVWHHGMHWWVSMNNVLLVIGLCCALLYFFFSRPHTGALGVASRIGIYFMMVSFGASFGYTVMGRLSLAVGRAQAMILRGPTTPEAPWPAIVAIVIIVGGLIILELTGKLKEPGEDESEA